MSAVEGRSSRRPPKPPAPSKTFEEIWRSSTPANILQTASEIGTVAAKVGKALVTPPFSWVGEMFEVTIQFCKRCAVPLAISMVAWVVGYAFVLLLGFVKLIGAEDRMAGTLVLGFTREPIIWVTGMVFAGATGASITADIAARKNREELDALSVLGIDTIRTLVLPRVIGAALACSVLGMFAIAVTVFTDWSLAPAFTHLNENVVWTGIVQSMVASDQIAALMKFFLIGVYVGLVSCVKGFSAKGGTEGVGRAVNQNIVLLFAGIWVLNSLFNLAYLTIFPQLADFKG